MSYSFALANNSGDLATGDLDIVFDSVGRFITLTGRDKLVQDIEKILFTEQNYFYSQYGTRLQSLIGTSPRVDELKLVLAKRVTDSLVYLQALQAGQQKYQALDGGEILSEIILIAVTYGGDISADPEALTKYTVEVTVSNAASEKITVSGNFDLGTANGN